MAKHIYPNSINSLKLGAKYQEHDVYLQEWSETKTITRFCASAKAEFQYLMNQGRIRIVIN